MAPVYLQEPYGKSVDAFSFALIVHEMFQGGPSNKGEDPEKLADKRAYEDSRPHHFSVGVVINHLFAAIVSGQFCRIFEVRLGLSWLVTGWLLGPPDTLWKHVMETHHLMLTNKRK